MLRSECGCKMGRCRESGNWLTPRGDLVVNRNTYRRAHQTREGKRGKGEAVLGEGRRDGCSQAGSGWGGEGGGATRGEDAASENEEVREERKKEAATKQEG